MVNKATERLKEIEKELNDITERLANPKKVKLTPKEYYNQEHTYDMLIGEKQGIILGLNESRKEVFERIERLFEKGIIRYPRFKELKQEMGVEE